MSTEDTSRKSLGGTLRPTTSDYLFCGHERAGLLRFQHSLGASVCPRCKERKPFYWDVFSGLGRVTKERGSRGPRGPLDVFREGSHPRPRGDTSEEVSGSGRAVF